MRSLAVRSSAAALTSCIVAFTACGGAPPPKAPEPTNDAPQAASTSGMQVASELGDIDTGALKATFHGLEQKFMDCQKKRLDDVEVISGDVTFFLRIGKDGGVKWTYFTESDVGDHDTEACMLDVVRATTWPKPTGGEAEVTYQIGLPQQASRDATAWPSDKITPLAGSVAHCKEGSSATYHVTAYVAPSHGGGKVVAVGVAPGEKDADDKVTCIVNEVRKLKLPSPGSWTAKVSFTL
jgi:hypothetical protein